MTEETDGTVAESTEADTAEEENEGTDGQQADDTDGQEEAGKAKTFTQEELDNILAKERARAERKARQRFERDYQRQQPDVPKAPANQAPKRTDYATDDEWIDAKYDYKEQLKELERAKESAAKEQSRNADLAESRYEEAEKIPEFDRDVFDSMLESHELSDLWAQTLLESDDAPKIMAYLSANPKEFKRISGLSPTRQAADIGKLESLLEKKTKPATTPITNVKGGSVNNVPLMKMTPAQIAALPMKEFEKRLKADRARN